MKRNLIVGLALVAVLTVWYAASATLRIDNSASTDEERVKPLASRPATADDVDESIRTIEMNADFGVIYTDINNLTSASDAVVRGSVVGTRFVEYNEGVWTVSSVRVIESWTPGVKVGDTITVVEEGGITSEAFLKRSTGRPLDAPVTAQEEQAKVRVLLEGAPLPEIGDEATYFLAKGAWDIVSGDYYDVVGTFQGKFLIEGGAARRHPLKGGSPAYRALDGSVPDLETAVRNSLSRAQ